MELAIDAARARATVGEISLALENVYGRYKPVNRVVSGAYRAAYAAGDEVKAILARVDQFAKQEGTRRQTADLVIAEQQGWVYVHTLYSCVC